MDHKKIRCVMGTLDLVGCEDSDYLEFGNVNGQPCETPVILGCMDEQALNFNPEATLGAAHCIDDASSSVPCGGENVLSYQGVTHGLLELNNRCWFDRNLSASTFQNGDAFDLQDLNEPGLWSSDENLTAGAPHQYSEVSDYYGYLYNQNAVADERGICPNGWHVSNLDDWVDMAAILGGFSTLPRLIRVSDDFGVSDAFPDGLPQKWPDGHLNADWYGFHLMPGTHMQNDGSGHTWLQDGAGYLYHLVNEAFDFVYQGEHDPGAGAVRCVKD